jgi:hypothetical protein
MKAIAVIVAACALVFSSAFTQTTHEQKAQPLYVCPMHPEVTSNKPGKCPKCKMDLLFTGKKNAAKPKTQQKNSHAPVAQPKITGEKPALVKDSTEKAGSGKATVMYTCPMHPDVVSDKPGKCPRCHMDLVKKNND